MPEYKMWAVRISPRAHGFGNFLARAVAYQLGKAGVVIRFEDAESLIGNKAHIRIWESLRPALDLLEVLFASAALFRAYPFLRCF